MKVALSASYWNVPCVREILLDCDIIYSTNINAKDSLCELFRNVRFIPDSCADMMEFLRNRHEGAEFVDFSDLRKMIRESLIAGNIETARSLADYFGFKITEQKSGKEKWENLHMIGFCDIHEVPHNVFEHMQKSF